MIMAAAMILGGLLMMLGKYESPEPFRWSSLVNTSSNLRLVYKADVPDDSDLGSFCRRNIH